MQSGTAKTIVIAGQSYFVEKVKAYFYRGFYYKVWKMNQFPAHDQYLGIYNTLAQFRECESKVRKGKTVWQTSLNA